MATWDDVERIALGLAGVEESTTWANRCWKVKGRTFVWVRPFSKKDLADLADLSADVPGGEIAGVRVADFDDKAAVLEAFDVCFTIPHFKNYAAVLIRLDDVPLDVLAELVTDAWMCMAG